MDSANIPITLIQNILGHECRKTTEIYLHSRNEDKSKVMEIYEKARSNNIS